MSSASVPNFNRLNLWPLEFLRSGLYSRSYSYLNARMSNGVWWSSVAGSATGGHSLGSWIGNVGAQSNYWRGHGFAVRKTKLFPR